MKTSLQKRRNRQRKCRHCHELYTPDPRNRRHQRYCSKPQCRQASKRAAQQRWLSSDGGQGYFQSPENVVRVQQWRAGHPGYWKRPGTKRSDALQDVLTSEVVETKEDTLGLNGHALQDVCSSQPALLIGLIASLTGSTLQDHIAETTRQFIVSGRDILKCGP